MLKERNIEVENANAKIEVENANAIIEDLIAHHHHQIVEKANARLEDDLIDRDIAHHHHQIVEDPCPNYNKIKLRKRDSKLNN